MDPRHQDERDAADIHAAKTLRIDLQTQGGRHLVDLMEAQVSDELIRLIYDDPLTPESALAGISRVRGIAAVLDHIGHNLRHAAGLTAKVLKRQAMQSLTVLFVVLLLLCPAPSSAQQYQERLDPAARYGYLQSAATQTGSGQVVKILGQSMVSFNVSGTFVGTVEFEATTNPLDTTTWISVPCTPLSGGATVTNATAPGIWRCDVAGLGNLRARVSAYTSGSVTVSVTTIP